MSFSDWTYVDIIFTKSKKFMPIFSWAIRAWTRKPYSHVVRHKEILGEKMFYQASEGKVNYEHKKIFDKKHEVVRFYRIKVPKSLEREMGRACLQEAGQPYATMQNVGILIQDILQFFGISFKNPWKKGRNCSELLYVTVLKPMFPDLNLNPDSVKPHHIEQILIDRGYTTP